MSAKAAIQVTYYCDVCGDDVDGASHTVNGLPAEDEWCEDDYSALPDNWEKVDGEDLCEDCAYKRRMEDPDEQRWARADAKTHEAQERELES
jgi:ribosome-binding protein aMBF1 (putative translation factor)